MNEISQSVQQKVADIAAMTRDESKIDSKAEMAELGKLLNGDYTEAEKKYIEQKMEEGRQNVGQSFDQQIDKDKVSKFVKNLIKKIGSIGGDRKKIDTVEEQKMMQNYLDDDNNGLSDTEKEYIQNEIFKGSSDIPRMPQIREKDGKKTNSFGL